MSPGSPTLSTYCSGVSVKSRPAILKVTSGMLSILSHSTTACTQFTAIISPKNATLHYTSSSTSQQTTVQQ